MGTLKDTTMKTFKQMLPEMTDMQKAHERLKKMKKGSEVSFTHATTGKKVTGTYAGLKRMGARSYAHVNHADGSTRVPVHQIH
tara:strand:- start:50 stop:298 length:249 start_codon:yes stop_codon:yes gene_type:complete